MGALELSAGKALPGAAAKANPVRTSTRNGVILAPSGI
jgi:hypothetical protein